MTEQEFRAEEQSAGTGVRGFVLGALMWIITGVAVYAMSYVNGRGMEETLRNTVTALTGCGVLLYLMADARIHATLAYDNERHTGRFAGLYLICLAVSLFLPMITYLAWPYVVIFVLLSFFSDKTIGFYAGALLLLISVLLTQDGGAAAFFLYLTSGAVGCAMFDHLDEELKVTTPILVTLLMQTVLLIGYHVLFLHTAIGPETFVIPFINLVFSAVLLFVATHIFAMSVIRRDNDNYMDVNDPEFSLLSAMRQKNKDEYFRAIHTAYLADRIATDLSFNGKAIKSCAYYHRIGCLTDEMSDWDAIAHYFEEFDFPKEAVTLLKEYVKIPENGVISKEATTVMFCDTIVSSLMYMFKKDKDTKVNYDDLIDRVFAHKLEAGELTHSELTMKEFDRMRALLKREKLYYDFLR